MGTATVSRSADMMSPKNWSSIPLIQSTYLGGSGDDYANAIAVSGGNVYLTGYTSSTDFPGTVGGAQPASGGGIDSFVTLLSGDLKTLIQSTYLGGSGDDYANALTVSGGNVYVTGYTSSTDFPGHRQWRPAGLRRRERWERCFCRPFERGFKDADPVHLSRRKRK